VSNVNRIRIVNMLGMEVEARVEQTEKSSVLTLKDPVAGLYICEVTQNANTFQVPVVIW